MNKFVTLLCLFVALSTVRSEDCTYAADLRDVYGFDSSFTTSRTYSDIKYCNSIKNGQVCCTDTDMNSIAQISADYVSNLTTLVSARDTYLKTIKDTVIPSLTNNINSFNSVSQTFIANYEKQQQEAGDNSDAADAADMTETFIMIANTTSQLVSGVTTINAEYGTYQTDRRNCIITMVDLQNSALCLSCDPDAENNGLTVFDADTFGFTMSDATCSRLQTSCKPYIEDAVGQNQLIEFVTYSNLLTGLTSAMQSYNNGNYQTALDEMETLLQQAQEAEYNDGITDFALVNAELPTDCDTSANGNCDWICGALFMNGILDPIALVAGGEYYLMDDFDFSDESDGGRRRRLEKRSLANGEWEPAQGDSGVTVSFAVDPANTNPSTTGKKFGSLSLGNVFTGIMVIISSILLF